MSDLGEHLTLEVVQRLRWDSKGHFWWDPKTSCDYLPQDVMGALASALEENDSQRKRIKVLEAENEMLRQVARFYKEHVDTDCAETGCVCIMRGVEACSAWIDAVLRGEEKP